MKLECDVIRDLLPLYAEKLASPASSALVEQHLAACPACRAELERMEKPVSVQPEPQPDAPLKNIRSSLNRRRLRTMLCSFAAALALAAVCGFGWYGATPPATGYPFLMHDCRLPTGRQKTVPTVGCWRPAPRTYT